MDKKFTMSEIATLHTIANVCSICKKNNYHNCIEKCPSFKEEKRYVLNYIKNGYEIFFNKKILDNKEI